MIIGLPRAHHDHQGVHAHRHRRGRLLAGRARAHVLQCQGKDYFDKIVFLGNFDI